jgi:hypothetical protein
MSTAYLNVPLPDGCDVEIAALVATQWILQNISFGSKLTRAQRLRIVKYLLDVTESEK